MLDGLDLIEVVHNHNCDISDRIIMILLSNKNGDGEYNDDKHHIYICIYICKHLSYVRMMVLDGIVIE
jgi:hypothetical protein